MNECYQASKENKRLYTLINCLTSMLTMQVGNTYKELPSTENADNQPQTLPLKNDSVKMIQKILLDTLKSLNYFNNVPSAPIGHPKSIMPPPSPLMLQNAPANIDRKSVV